MCLSVCALFYDRFLLKYFTRFNYYFSSCSYGYCYYFFPIVFLTVFQLNHQHIFY